MLLSLALVWGSSFLFIKVAVDDGVPPAFLAWARVLLGAVIVGALALVPDMKLELRPASPEILGQTGK